MDKIQRTLLIVDDVFEDRQAYKRYFLYENTLDWRVLEAETGEEAIEQVKRNEITAVLLDYSLPGDDGLTVMEELIKVKHDIAVLILTGNGNEKLVKMALQQGAADYLIKDDIKQFSLQYAVEHAVEFARNKARAELEFEELRLFANVLSQELKSPARHVQIMSSGLAMRLNKGESAEQCQELITNIQKECDHLIGMVGDLHEYTRVGEGLTDPVREINFSEVVGAAKNHLAPLIDEKQAEVNCNADLEFKCQASTMIQLFQHIIENGIIYNNSLQPSVDVRLYGEGDSWFVEFEDNGIGIRLDHLGDVFRPFHRLMNNFTVGGSGLGLATCQKIAALHGGRIYCRSALGEGSCFILELPKDTKL